MEMMRMDKSRMDKSKISDRSERYSFMSDVSGLDLSSNKGLRENKTMVNNRPSNGGNSGKKPRFMNIEEVTHCMKYPNY